MKESTKNSLKLLVVGLSFILIFSLITFLVPDESIFKKVFGYLLFLTLIFGIIWFTGLGNPIKNLYRKIFKK